MTLGCGFVNSPQVVREVTQWTQEISNVRAGWIHWRLHMELIVSSFIAIGALLFGHFVGLVKNRFVYPKA